MKILITGGCGFIGSHLTERLLREGHSVAIIDSLSSGCMEGVSRAANLYICDIRKPETETAFIEFGPDAVYHLAAQISAPESINRPAFDADLNIVGTANILDWSRKLGVKKFIYSSSAAVYGDPVYTPIDERHPVKPLSFYGLSKLTAEDYVRMFHSLHGLNYTILRFANIYGPGQKLVGGAGGVIPLFARSLRAGEQVTIEGDGGQTRDFLYVEDLAEILLRALSVGNELVNAGSGKATSLLELYRVMKTITGSALEPRFKEPRAGDIRHSVFNIAKMKKLTGYEPVTTLEEGLRALLG